jgi:hypothetical protein
VDRQANGGFAFHVSNNNIHKMNMKIFFKNVVVMTDKMKKVCLDNTNESVYKVLFPLAARGLTSGGIFSDR